MLTRRDLARCGASALLLSVGQHPAAAAPSHAHKRRRAARVPRPVNDPARLAALSPALLLAAQLELAGALLLGGGARRGTATAACSPLSLAGALSVVAMGCDAAMRDGIFDALRFRQPLSAAAAQSLLASFGAIARPGAEGPASPLTLASRLVIDPAVEPIPAVVQGLRQYGVDIEEASLADPKTVDAVNAWVRHATRDLIPSILDAPPGSGGLVALNALHFKDRWKQPFDPNETVVAPFHGLDGRTEPVHLMTREGRFRFGRQPGFAAVDLDFATDRFALAVVTSLERPATAAELWAVGRRWLAGEQLSESAGSLALPRLALASSADLLGPLRRLGFQPGALRFFGARPPTLSAVKQRTLFKMTEEGAEAAAATAAIATRSLDTRFVRLVVDKPFWFALRDRTTGFVPIAGYLGRLQAGGASA